MNKIQAAQIRSTMQSLSTLIRISVSISEVKKNLHWSMIGENVMEYLEESELSEVLTKKLGLLYIQLRGLGGGAIPGRFWYLYLHLNWLETVR